MSNFVTLKQAVSMTHAPLGSGGSQHVIVTYKSGKTFGLPMEADRFVKFLAVVRKAGLPVNGQTLVTDKVTSQPVQLRFELGDHNPAEIKILFHSARLANAADFYNLVPEDINGIIIEGRIVIAYEERAQLCRRISAVVRAQQLMPQLRGNQATLSI